MDLSETFEVITGTTAGRRHRTAANLMNNQDAVSRSITPGLIVGSVSDGCGSQPHSEFGARTTVNILPRLIRKHHYTGGSFDEEGLDLIYQGLVRHLLRAAKNLLDGPVKRVLESHMMATAGGVILTPSNTIFYGAGDFVFVVNGQTYTWEPEEGNQPLYPILRLAFPNDPRFRFRTHTIPTSDLKSFMLATDGGNELLQVCSDDMECFPGTDDPVGPIDQIWTNNEFYTDDATLGTWLNRLAQNWRMPGPPHHGGLLDDDTTLFAGRRKEIVAA